MTVETQMSALSKLSNDDNLSKEEMLKLAAIAFPHFSKEERAEMVNEMLSDEFPPLEQ